MGTQVSDALDALRELGTPAEIRALADRGYGPASPPRVNSHIHLPPNFSAFDSVEQAVSLAADQQIGVLGVSNYYDYDVYGEFVERARSRGIFPLFGLEIISMQADLRDAGIKVNDPGNPGKTYLCGKGITRFDAMSPEAARLIDVIRRNDCRADGDDGRSHATTCSRSRGLEMRRRRTGRRRHDRRPARQPARDRLSAGAAYFAGVSGSRCSDACRPEERLGRFERSCSVRRPKLTDPHDHVGVQNELRSHLMKAGKPAFVEESFLSFEEARRLVLELGGIPSYPVLADGASPMCEFEADPDKLIRELQARSVHAVEWIPVRNKRASLLDYVTKMRAAGLAVTAGTEHNTLDLIPFDPCCKDGDVPASIRDVFWEGACVVAAHQFLSLHGECGYVDADGRPNADLRIGRRADQSTGEDRRGRDPAVF